MGNQNIPQPYLWSEIPFSETSYFLLCKISDSVYVTLNFSIQQTSDTFTSKNLIQLGNPRITQLLATQSDCPRKNNLKRFSLTRAQKFTQVFYEIEWPGTFVSVRIRAKTKRNKAFRFSATIPKTRVFLTKGEHS